MPNKTIYVKDEDLGLFEEAKKLGGESLSSVIAEALRRFVATKRAEQQGMKECNLTVGVLRSQGLNLNTSQRRGESAARAEGQKTGSPKKEER